ncbi:hypothetical protein [Sphingobacterium gobiense]|uniref:hypothetical protein n=1 Tax=Sphingobacterium gobiense TaxID=1382456 RepID=UPI0015E41AB1|nr:hypothetical protein [Sphingobacterium gobiense]
MKNIKNDYVFRDTHKGRGGRRKAPNVFTEYGMLTHLCAWLSLRHWSLRKTLPYVSVYS